MLATTLGQGIAAPQSFALDALNPALIEQGYGEARIGRSTDGRPMVMGGKTYTQGIGTHAKSAIEFKLDGKALAFTAVVGMSESGMGTKAKAGFAVEGDGKVLWESGPMTPEIEPKAVAVKLDGVRLLVLRVNDGGNGIDYDHANWADAAIAYAGTAPEPGGRAINFATDHLRFGYVVRKSGMLELDYAGARDGSWRAPLRGPAWPGQSDCKFHDAPVAIVQANGDTALNLVHESDASVTESAGVEHVTITLRDTLLPLRVELHFRVFAREDVIEQWTVARNGLATPVRIGRLDSAYWPGLESSAPHLEWYDGEAGKPEREKLGHGRRLLESRGGNRHIQGPSPAFVMSFGGFADEATTPCLVAALGWSGSARMSFDCDTQGKLAVAAGPGPQAGPFTLDAGGSLASPVCIHTLGLKGKGEASRNLHQWTRRYGMRDAQRLRLVDNNSWEGCYFNVSETTVIDMMKGSADLGIELYVLDDGWFGNGKNARRGDVSGLGDWQVNRALFPNGIERLVAAGKEIGISFGLWFEPEMINPRSDLIEKHPEWVLRNPGRELKLQRNQAVLDLANPAVQEFCLQVVDDILSANPGIRFVKWDANSDINNPYSPFLAAERQGDLLQRYFAGYYGVLRKLVAKHPQVDFQACAAGGGRADLGALRFSHTFWVSDNTDPMFRLGAQWNLSTFLPPNATTCHVTHAGTYQPKFRFDVSMMGQLGMEIDPRRAEPDYQAAARTGIAAYKSVRDIVQLGRQYRHRSPFESATPSLNFVSPDHARALVLAYQTGPAQAAVAAVAPVAGLDPAKSYRLAEINLPPGDDQPRLAPRAKTTASGREWMDSGIPLVFTRRHDSAALTLLASP